jgi:hypothetical protein
MAAKRKVGVTHKCTRTSTCVGEVSYAPLGDVGVCDCCGAVYVMSGTDITDDAQPAPRASDAKT